MSEENGVVITSREIYESVNNLTEKVNGLGGRFDKLEEQIKDQNQTSNEAKERSHEAIKLATEANQNATESAKDAEQALDKIGTLEKERYEEKIEANKKEKETRNRFYIAVISALIPWLITVGLGVIYFAKSGGI